MGKGVTNRRWVGRLFWFDLARLARRGRTALLRGTYAFLLLAVLVWLFYQRFPRHFTDLGRLFQEGPMLSLQERGLLARQFVLAGLTLQAAFVLAVTPAYLAGAVAEEKERDTLKLLFTTPLFDREIVLGKLLGRLTHLATVVLVGLPILCLIPIWGGVEGNLVVAGFVATACGLLSTGGLSILCSVLAPNVLRAVLSSYGLVILMNLVCLAVPFGSPLTFLLNCEQQFTALQGKWHSQVEDLRKAWQTEVELGRQIQGQNYRPPPPPVLPPAPNLTRLLLAMLAACAVQNGVIFVLCTAAAVGCLRTYGGAARPVLSRAPPRSSLRQSTDRRAVSGRPAVAFRRRRRGPIDPPELQKPQGPQRLPSTRPRVTDDPLLWKELYGGASALPEPPTLKEWLRAPISGPMLVLAALFLVLWGLFLVLYLVGGASATSLQLVGLYLVRIGTLVLAGFWCVDLAFRAAGSVCKERERRTLEGLLLLPVERTEILRAKWLGSVLRGRVLGFGLAALWFAGLITGVLHPWAVLLLAGGVAMCIAALASLGIWLSLASRNTLWANLTMALVLMLVLGGSLLRANLGALSLYQPAPPTWAETFSDVGLHPLRAWWLATFSWYDLVNTINKEGVLFANRLTAILAGEVVLGLLAWGFWRLACARFRRESDQRRSPEVGLPR